MRALTCPDDTSSASSLSSTLRKEQPFQSGLSYSLLQNTNCSSQPYVIKVFSGNSPYFGAKSPCHGVKIDRDKRRCVLNQRLAAHLRRSRTSRCSFCIQLFLPAHEHACNCREAAEATFFKHRGEKRRDGPHRFIQRVDMCAQEYVQPQDRQHAL